MLKFSAFNCDLHFHFISFQFISVFRSVPNCMIFALRGCNEHTISLSTCAIRMQRYLTFSVSGTLLLQIPTDTRLLLSFSTNVPEAPRILLGLFVDSFTCVHLLTYKRWPQHIGFFESELSFEVCGPHLCGSDSWKARSIAGNRQTVLSSRGWSRR